MSHAARDRSALPGSRVRRVPHWLVPLGMYAVVAALVWAESGDRLL
ncbi:hypothetical protein [Streptomyces sp. NPDC050485]